MKRPARVALQLPESLHKRLNAYALAATATGVGALALAQPAEAKIAYTPAHVVLGARSNSDYPLDINHDGIADLYLNHFYYIQSTHGGHRTFNSEIFVPYATKVNKLNGVVVNRIPSAFAFPAGVKVGPLDNFSRSGALAFAGGPPPGPPTLYLWQWANDGKGLKNHYLGIRFIIKNKTHYGWARVSVSKWPFAATLTGYAYETIPNKPILAGKTHGGDEATLGHLATGASAISTWRVKPTAAVTH